MRGLKWREEEGFSPLAFRLLSIRYDLHCLRKRYGDDDELFIFLFFKVGPKKKIEKCIFLLLVVLPFA